MAKNSPIGIFDSGVGGLTVANAIADALPKESFIYFGDTKHLPYGDKSNEAITKYSLEIVDFLIGEGCKAIVIACNTASAIAYDVLNEKYGKILPVINVIDPVVEAIALRKHHLVGVIGTRATINSRAYETRLHKELSDVHVSSVATPLLVPVIEEGLAHTSISRQILAHYLSNPALGSIQALILGCTHYPLLHQEIEDLLENKVEIIDSPQIVAESVSQILSAHGILANQKHSSHLFYLSDYTETFHRIAKTFFSESIDLIEKRLD
jgi:glutamate racemase